MPMNNYPDDFNISSDYATISAKERGITQLVLPQGLSVASGGYYIQIQENYIAGDGILRLLVNSSTNPERAITASRVTFTRTFAIASGSTPFASGSTTPMSILISGWRESKNKIVCALSISNPYDATVINQNATETFYVDARDMTFPY